MQSSGPAARPGPKFRPGRAFCGARAKSAGLMPGSRDKITMYHALAAGLCAVLGRCWPGSMLGSSDIVRCRSGLGLDFWRNFCISSKYPYSHVLRLSVATDDCAQSSTKKVNWTRWMIQNVTWVITYIVILCLIGQVWTLPGVRVRVYRRTFDPWVITYIIILCLIGQVWTLPGV